jgi:hypothetical protein
MRTLIGLFLKAACLVSIPLKEGIVTRLFVGNRIVLRYTYKSDCGFLLQRDSPPLAGRKIHQILHNQEASPAKTPDAQSSA